MPTKDNYAPEPDPENPDPMGNALRPTPCTCHMLRRTARRISQFYDQALKPAGLRLSQYSVLAHARQTDALTITDLADILDVDRTTLTRNLRPLVQAGWITIDTGTDKRSRAVRLTPAGEKIHARALPLWQQAERDFRANMGKDNANNLRHLLDDATISVNAGSSAAP